MDPEQKAPSPAETTGEPSECQGVCIQTQILRLETFLLNEGLYHVKSAVPAGLYVLLEPLSRLVDLQLNVLELGVGQSRLFKLSNYFAADSWRV